MWRQLEKNTLFIDIGTEKVDFVEKYRKICKFSKNQLCDEICWSSDCTAVQTCATIVEPN